MKRRIAILTKSKKYNGYCVAGIDMDTNEWVRLERCGENSLKEEHLTATDGRVCRVLDVVEVECLDRASDKAYQPENVYINPDVSFKRLYRTGWDDIISRGLEIKENDTILGIRNYRETPLQVSRLKDLRSLQLIKVTGLTIYNDAIEYKNEDNGTETKNKIKAKFTYRGHEYKLFSVTDFDYMDVAKERDIHIPSAYLVVSRGVEYKQKNDYTYHYSIVAKVIKDTEARRAA